MLYLVVILSLLSVSFADEKIKHRLPAAVNKVFKDAAADCLKETEVSKEISDNFFAFKYENNADTKKFMYCLCRKTNYADEDGHFNDATITLFEGSDRKDEVQKIIDECNNIKESDKLETMFKTFMCVYEKSPVVLSI